MGDKHTYHKLERLTDEKVIDAIFQKKGKSILRNPILFIFIEYENPGPFPAQTLISVSKRKFKRASDRNLIKRRLREAFRLNKQALYNHINLNKKQFAFALIYLNSTISDYQTIEKQLNLAINEFIERHT